MDRRIKDIGCDGKVEMERKLRWGCGAERAREEDRIVSKMKDEEGMGRY